MPVRQFVTRSDTGTMERIGPTTEKITVTEQEHCTIMVDCKMDYKLMAANSFAAFRKAFRSAAMQAEGHRHGFIG